MTNPLAPSGPVSRTAYLAWGFGLALTKYAVEALFVAATSGRTLGPLEFLSPSVSRLDEFARLGDWAGPLYVVWTLPFVYVCAAMSVRRAATAGISPWLGLLSLAPFLNLAVFAFLGFAPSRPPRPAADPKPESDPRLIPDWPTTAEETRMLRAENLPARPTAPTRQTDSAGTWTVAGIFFGPIYTVAMVFTCVYVLKDYGAPLFFLTPILVGAVAGYCANAVERVGAGPTLGFAALAALASYGGLLVVAWEGIVCLLMALPLALPLALIGGALGGAIANTVRSDDRSRWDSGATACLMLAPLGSVVAPANEAPIRPVVTSIVVDAPPAAVWERVIAFPELDPPEEWYFETGLAYPVGAVIEGEGVGAVRRCRFSTGEFVEPITAWEPPGGDGTKTSPGRLAFRVSEQPTPMVEWHPWAEISPPHLHGTFESIRGEFLLEALPGDRTRLTGTTWCRTKMAPHGYWAAWTDAILHRVHGRVLGHVAELAEADTAQGIAAGEDL
ncbi:hypothetical protein [Alienimonas chondri]|uniref:SRPBCC domain-containing protein n=1 Tax=Alienimonas chondri TaxID=2681879 RepID=A0ABX1VMM8_9PLAN|nr:hypothetical protein [Alienimonas chondri]NNJ27736.1 hypothetical protein [Alienimonas chondri]